MSTSANPDHHTLLAAIDGDPSAQQIVLTQYYDLIQSVVWSSWHSQLVSVSEKEDISQEIIRGILQSLPTVDIDRLDTFPGWLKKVAESNVINLRRYWSAYDGARVALTGASGSSDGIDLIEQYRVTHSLPEKPVRNEEAQQALRVAMEALSDSQKEAINRKYFEHQSNAEIAEAMNRSGGAIRMLLGRGEENLRGLMGSRSKWLSSR
jgi:RNA polymerase sigma-70 factor (ECF subfamily)